MDPGNQKLMMATRRQDACKLSLGFLITFVVKSSLGCGWWMHYLSSPCYQPREESTFSTAIVFATPREKAYIFPKHQDLVLMQLPDVFRVGLSAFLCAGCVWKLNLP
jgi:hypothetical protein